MKKEKKKRVSISTIILVGIMIVGIGVMAYPWISDYINRRHASRAVAGYSEALSGMLFKEQMEKELFRQ